MKFFSKTLIIAYILLSSASALTFLALKTTEKEIKEYVKSKLVTPKLSRGNDKKWANEILKGGFILFFRHAERDKWLDVAMYDALESNLDHKENKNFRFAEKEYFSGAVCLNSRGKIQARAMKEVIEYSGLPIGYSVSSPSCRARQTADIAFGGYQQLSQNLVYEGPYNEKDNSSNLKDLLLSLPIEERTNTVISAHNSVVKCSIFKKKVCDLKLYQGGFYVIKKDGQDLKLVYQFHNFLDFSRVFFKR